jgi:hypothetical protein
MRRNLSLWASRPRTRRGSHTMFASVFMLHIRRGNWAALVNQSKECVQRAPLFAVTRGLQTSLSVSEQKPLRETRDKQAQNMLMQFLASCNSHDGEATYSSETSAGLQGTTQRYIPGYRALQFTRRGYALCLWSVQRRYNEAGRTRNQHRPHRIKL